MRAETGFIIDEISPVTNEKSVDAPAPELDKISSDLLPVSLA
jgi:hypothetical protein